MLSPFLLWSMNWPFSGMLFCSLHGWLFFPGLSSSVTSSQKPFLSASFPVTPSHSCLFPLLHFYLLVYFLSPLPGNKLHLHRAHIRCSVIIHQWMNEWMRGLSCSRSCASISLVRWLLSRVEIIPINSPSVFYSPLGPIAVINHYEFLFQRSC